MSAGLLLVCSVLVSYDRSIQVGAVLACVWLLVWRALLSGRRVSKNWSLGLLAAAGLGAVILFSSVGVDSLYTRWTRDFERGMPGSGRLDFYHGALERFADGSLADMLVGIGYTGIRQTMRDRCGLPIHTHSDLFDLLLGGGLLGLAVYLVLWRNVVRQCRSVSSRSAEFALMGACLAIFLVMSLITGQLEATHAMFCLGACLHCCGLLAPG
jgi:O-antigen ligase